MTNPHPQSDRQADTRAISLLNEMTLHEKIGQLQQVNGNGGQVTEHLRSQIKQGLVGSVINEVNADALAEVQRIAIEESRLGIPLLIGRDVIHGFRTIFPIPLGQAASWCEETIKQGAEIAATEASIVGINWTFAPMIDITRDPRWGRIAECLGEDPVLNSRLTAAMISGFQGEDLSSRGSLAACAKHFAGYGYTESGKDYHYANISENELRNVVLPPFKTAVEASVATFMSSFSDLNGIPASASEWLMQDILRDEWQFKGMVVSDWGSIKDLSTHGLTANDKESAYESASAGIDMEMVSTCYQNHFIELMEENKLSEAQLDSMVLRILRLKFQLGLFDDKGKTKKAERFDHLGNDEFLAAAKNAAVKSCVLLQNNTLKNGKKTLPLNVADTSSIAVIGPLADDAYEQMGTWIFDGDEALSISVSSAIKETLKDNTQVKFAKGVSTSRCNKHDGFAEAIECAKDADQVVMVLGEESILSGEAHCRSDISLPGAQEALVDAIAELGKPIVLVIMAGRPLTIASITNKVDAILYAWHPGTMGGPAIRDLLFGYEVPSGKLPVTFPRVIGQIPIYYSQKNSGRPATDSNFVHQNDIPLRAAQTSLGMAANHLDVHFTPLYPFGFGLSYAEFEYKNLELSCQKITSKAPITVSVEVFNKSDIDADEIVQLYIRDLVGNVTRPIKELKHFKRVSIKAKSSKKVEMTLSAKDLGFYGRDNTFLVESGQFHLWVGADSSSGLFAEFVLEA